MSIKNKVELFPLTCMSPANGIEICPVDSGKHLGTSRIHQPLFGHETTLVTIAPGTVEDLFVHHFQTDQLLVVQGSVVLVVLQNRRYQYILMSECKPTIVKIPPGIPHGAINMSSQPCIVINSVLRHGPADQRDYRPLHQPFPYDLDVVKAMLAKFPCSVSV